MIVRFGRRGVRSQKTLGKIVKINQKNLKVKTLEERGRFKAHEIGGIWTVHPALCEAVAAS